MTQRFICNGMLGKLSRLLRMVGIDTAYSNEGMAILIDARKEGRIIVTRNTNLRGRNGVFFVDTARPVSQLRELVDAYDLWDAMKPFSRCILCNEMLSPVEKKAVKGKVPFFTYLHFDEYAQCGKCGRVYWKGSHYRRMMSEVARALDKNE